MACPHGLKLTRPDRPYPKIPAGGVSDCCYLCWRAGRTAPAGVKEKEATLPVSQPPAEPRCARLGTERVPLASARTYYRCGGGYGSTTADERRGLVADCGTCGKNKAVWRVGDQCGPKCDGFSASPDPQPGTAADDDEAM